ncbi:hypothetical protein H4R35_002773, partial [Dimargaris xerosporica]
MTRPQPHTPGSQRSTSPSDKAKPKAQATLLPTPDTTPLATTDELLHSNSTLENNTPCRGPTQSSVGLASSQARDSLPNGQPSSPAQGRSAAVKLDFEPSAPEPKQSQVTPMDLSSLPLVIPAVPGAPVKSPIVKQKGAKAMKTEKRPCGCCQRPMAILTQLFDMELCAHCIPLFAVSPRVSRASKISNQHVASKPPSTATKRGRDRPNPLPLPTQNSVNHDKTSTAGLRSAQNIIKCASVFTKKPRIDHTAVAAPSVVESRTGPVATDGLIVKSEGVEDNLAQTCIGSVGDDSQGIETKSMTADSSLEAAQLLPKPQSLSPQPNSAIVPRPCPAATSVSAVKANASVKSTVGAMLCESCNKPTVRRQRVGAIAVCSVCAPLFGAPPTTRRATRQRMHTGATKSDAPLAQPRESPTSLPTSGSTESKRNGAMARAYSTLPCKRPRHDSPTNAAPSSPLKVPSATSNNADNPSASKKAPTVASYITTGAFLTRNTLKRLTEASHGFVEDFHQFHLFEKVMVLQRDRNWYPARLVAIEGGKTLAKYLDHDLWPSEWLSLDSRRLKSMVTFDQLRSRPTKRHRVSSAAAASPLPPTNAAASPGAVSAKTGIAHASSGFTPGGYQVLQQMFDTPSTFSHQSSSHQPPHGPLSNVGAFGAGLFVLLPPFDAITDYACCISPGDSLRVRDGQKQWCNATALGHDNCCVSVMYTGYTNSGRSEAIPLNSPRLKVQIRKLHQLWQREQSDAKEVSPQPLAPSPSAAQLAKEPTGSAKELVSDAASISTDASSSDRSQGLLSQPQSSKLASLLYAMKQTQVSPPLPANPDPSLQLVRELVQNAAPRGTSQPTFASAIPAGPAAQSALAKTLQQEFANLTHPQAKPPTPPRSSLASLLLAATQRDPPPKKSAVALDSAPELKEPSKTNGPSSVKVDATPESLNPDQGSLVQSGAVGDRVLIRNTKGQWLNGLILDLTATQALIRWPKRKTWFDRTNPRLRLAPPDTNAIVAPKPATPSSQPGAAKASKPAKSPVAPAPKGTVRRPAKPSRPTAKTGAKVTRRAQVPTSTSDLVDDALQPLPSALADEADYDQHWTIYCNCCQCIIQQVRFYCTYCENPSDGFDYESFELCLFCFEHQFPVTHQHPKTSFAMQWLTAPNEKSQFSSLQLTGQGGGDATQDVGEMVQRFAKDRFDCESLVVSHAAANTAPAVHNRIRLDGILNRK